MATANKSSSDASVGLLTDTDLSQRNPLGFHVADENGNQYIYLSGIASTIATDWVNYGQTSATPWATVLAVHSGVGPVAVAMAAPVLVTQFGWYQIFGAALGACLVDIAANHAVYLTSTAGSVDDAAVATDTIYGAISSTALTGVIATFMLAFPFTLGVQPT